MRHSVHAFLRDCLKVTNWALLLMGLGFALTSGYFLLQFTRASHDALADASAPPPIASPVRAGTPSNKHVTHRPRPEHAAVVRPHAVTRFKPRMPRHILFEEESFPSLFEFPHFLRKGLA